MSQANEGSQKGNSAVTSLRILAHGKAKPGQPAVLRALVVDLLKNSRRESGLEIYEAFESLDGQEIIQRTVYGSGSARSAYEHGTFQGNYGSGIPNH
jgi:hypothetical protein